ncbi:MAG: copper amine oxidase N-terminal domain-containing protein [Defluviitaleaceae bacterium]|nr:copper amine oxidase N-terminal domain-containing protein [Defluviitaleaceae bacterium]
MKKIMNKIKTFGAVALGGLMMLSAVPVLAVSPPAPEGWYEARVVPTFLTFSGIIQSITQVEENTHILVRNSGGLNMTFVKNFNTFVLGDHVAVGDSITGYYYSSGVAAAIYPPRHIMRLITTYPFSTENVFIGRYEELEQTLPVDIPVQLQGGDNVRDILTERNITLSEFLSGRLIVHSQNPSILVMLYERAMHPVLDIDFGLELGGGFEMELPVYSSFAGQITEIAETDDGRQFVHVENGYGAVTVFVKDFLTYVQGGELAVGDNVRGYYNINLPTVMIFPPQYHARAIVNNGETGQFIGLFTSLYENSMISGNDFILNFNENTQVHLQDGQNVRQILEEGQTLQEFMNNRTLFVNYTLQNRMMPPGTMPADPTLSVVVLFERAVHLPGMGLDLGLDFGLEQIEWTDNHGISVNGRMLDATWQEVNGGFYVPFRAVVNMLGHGETIGWDAASRSITVSNGAHNIRFAIGSYEYHVGEIALVLSHPAILIDDTTYVPFMFFRDVFGMNNAWMSGGQIFIDNYEIMH